MSKSVILIADNDHVNLKILEKFFNREGFSTVTASDMASARQVLQKGTVDLAILDIRLNKDRDERDTSGLLLAKAISPKLPKIIYTKFPTYRNVREAFLIDTKGLPPATDFVTKQEGLPLLLSAVKDALKTADNNKFLRALQKGDGEAWKRLWDEEAWRLIAIGRHYGLKDDEAMEVCMDIFRELAQDTPARRKQYTLKMSSLRATLTHKVLQKLTESVQGKGSKPGMPRARLTVKDKAEPLDRKLLADIASPAITNNISQDKFVGQLSAAIKELPPQQQKVIELRLFQRTSTPDIAKKLGVTEKTVRKHLGMALKHLKSKVAELGGK